MVDNIAGISEKTVVITPTPEQGTEKNTPQEFHAMQRFFTTITGNSDASEIKPSRAEVEKKFNLKWIRDNVAQKDVEDPDDGWYRERIDSFGVDLRIHIQPKGLSPDYGDMMLSYIGPGSQTEGNEIGTEVISLQSGIPESAIRSLQLTLLPEGTTYKYKAVLSDGEVLAG